MVVLLDGDAKHSLELRRPDFCVVLLLITFVVSTATFGTVMLKVVLIPTSVLFAVFLPVVLSIRSLAVSALSMTPPSIVSRKEGVKGLEKWLSGRGVENIEALNAVLAKGARPWQAKYGGEKAVQAAK